MMINNGDNGLVNRVRKDLGYESISRKMLQNQNISYQARGFLADLESLPDNFKIYKTGLYKRSPKNKRTMIDGIWNEIVEHDYIVQFRDSGTTRYQYKYFMSAAGFSREDKLELIEELKGSYDLYLNAKQKEIIGVGSENEYIEKLTNDTLGKVESDSSENSPSPVKKKEIEKDNVIDSQIRSDVGQDRSVKDSQSQSIVENQHRLHSNVPTSAENQQWEFPLLVSHSGKSTPLRFTNKGLEDEEEIIKIRQLTQNQELNEVAKILISSGVPADDMFKILTEMDRDKSLLDHELIISQLKWCVLKSQGEDGIYDFANYFLTGLRRKVSGSNLELRDDSLNSYRRSVGISDEDEEDIPLFNWLE